MSQLLKRVRKIIHNPGDVSHDDLVWLLEKFKKDDRSPGSGGSHTTYVVIAADGTPKIITVPKPKKGRQVGKTYVKQVIDLLELEEWYESHC